MFTSRFVLLAVFSLLFPTVVNGQPLLNQLRDVPPRDVEQPEREQELPAPGYLGAILDDDQQAKGIRVLEVIPNGPAAKGGLRKSDLVTSINEKPVRVMNDLAQFIKGSAAGTKLDFELTRPGTDTKPQATLELEITLGVRPPRSQRRFPEFGRIPEPPAQGEAVERENPGLLGVRAVPLDPVIVRQLRLPVARGAVVVAVIQGSAADRASLPRDAVIVAVNNRAIDSPDDLARRVQLAGPGTRIELAYYYRGQLIRKRITLANTTVGSPPPDVSPDRPRDNDRLSLEQRIEQLEAEVRELRRLLERR